jgi:hypothetical protein
MMGHMRGREAQKGDGEMPVEEAPEWPTYIFIGFESSEEDLEGSEEEAEGEEESDEEGEAEGEESKGENVEGLKSALRKERIQRRNAEKELKKLHRGASQKDEQDTKDVAKANARAQSAEAKSEKLAAKLRDRAVDSEILIAATKMKFADVDDAIALLDRDDIDVEQNDDDPSDVQVDRDSIEEALKVLVKKKPHLLRVESEGGSDRSGGKFGGRRDGSKGDPDEEALKELYPALRR